jgi:hypothetical protein
MSQFQSPEQVAQRQIDAYNARDLEAWLATYAVDARQFEHPGTLLASGHTQIRARAAERFAEPNLHAHLIERRIIGSLVIEHEMVTRTFPEGPGRIELICLYEIRDGLIQSASFVFGARTLDPRV